jgi:hypothetical protein
MPSKIMGVEPYRHGIGTADLLRQFVFEMSNAAARIILTPYLSDHAL